MKEKYACSVHVMWKSNEGELQNTSHSPLFDGSVSLRNPDEIFVTAIATSYMLYYLKLCAESGIVVVSYEDKATGVFRKDSKGQNVFNEMRLSPVVTISNPSMESIANSLHDQAVSFCSNSSAVTFPIVHFARFKHMSSPSIL